MLNDRFYDLVDTVAILVLKHSSSLTPQERPRLANLAVCARASGRPGRRDPLLAIGTDQFPGGEIMMCAPAVPASISHGSPRFDFVDNPVLSPVANGQ